MPQRARGPRSRAVLIKRGRLGGLRSHEASPEEILAAQLDLKLAVAEDYIDRWVTEEPPLTGEQRRYLAELLTSTPGVRTLGRRELRAVESPKPQRVPTLEAPGSQEAS